MSRNNIVALGAVKGKRKNVDGVFVHKMADGTGYFIGADPGSRYYYGIDPTVVQTTYSKAIALRDKYIEWAKSEGL